MTDSSQSEWPLAPMDLIDDLPGTGRKYKVKIIMRDGDGQVGDDWHATITRLSDGKQIVSIAAWLWLLKWRTRRAALDRAFARVDRHDTKLAEVRERHV